MAAPDLDLSTLDPGIRNSVAWLRAHGFNTTDSGDGEAKPEDERTIEGPHVVISVPARFVIRETNRLYALLSYVGRTVGPMKPETVDGGDLAIQSMYDPADETAVIMVMGTIVHVCRFCGLPTFTPRDDQLAPVDYCHHDVITQGWVGTVKR